MANSKVIAIQDRIRRAQIDAAKMNPRQRRIFERYYAMGDDRTIERLYGWCKDEGVVISYQSLKNWSTRFGWQTMIQQIDEYVAEELGRLLLPDHLERVRRDLSAMQRLKQDFYARVEAGEIEITLEEYLKILKIEDTLTNRPTNDRPNDPSGEFTTVEVQLSKDELALAMAISASNKHGLPPPAIVQEMKNVTPISQD